MLDYSWRLADANVVCQREKSSVGDGNLPRYDYRCTGCGHQFELRQSFDSATVAECPECGADSNRKIHAPPVIFKGSGWYVTDYGRGRGNNGITADRAASKAADKEGDGESKSGAKASKAKSASASGGE